jgi:hypothetical protein
MLRKYYAQYKYHNSRQKCKGMSSPEKVPQHFPFFILRDIPAVAGWDTEKRNADNYCNEKKSQGKYPIVFRPQEPGKDNTPYKT